MTGLTDGFKDIFLAGIGAMAIGAEKSKDLVDQLIAKGELTVEQGKQINAELKHHAIDAAAPLRDDMIAAHIADMTPEQRDAFVSRVTEMAQKANEGESAPTEPADVADEAAAADGATAD